MFRARRRISSEGALLTLVPNEVGIHCPCDELLDVLDHGPAELVRVNRCQGSAIHTLIGCLQNAMPFPMSSAALCRTSNGEVGLESGGLLDWLAILIHSAVGTLICSLFWAEAVDLVLQVKPEPNSSTAKIPTDFQPARLALHQSDSWPSSSVERRFAEVLQGPHDGDTMMTSGCNRC